MNYWVVTDPWVSNAPRELIECLAARPRPDDASIYDVTVSYNGARVFWCQAKNIFANKLEAEIFILLARFDGTCQNV